MASLAVTTRRSWGWFGAWSLVGVAYSVALVGILSIGIFVLPIAIIGTVLLVRMPASLRGVYGLIAGLGLPPLYVAYLNRSYGGPACSTSGIVGPMHPTLVCIQALDPWPWLAVGLLLLAAGVTVFVIRSRPGVQGSG